MLTPQDAFNLVQKNVKGFDGDPIVGDLGSVYYISNGHKGDMDCEGEYTVDKNSGVITEITFLDYINAVRKLGDEVPKSYKVKSLS